MSSSSKKNVIVFGSTGAIGRHLIEIMSKKEPSWKIFAVTRSTTTTTNKFDGLSNVEVIQGDPNQRDEVMKLSKDKDLIFSCIGFSKYEAKYWAKHWPIVVENLLAATNQESGGPSKKLIFCDNLYAYGGTTNISPTTPTVPKGTHSKPAVRALIRELFQAQMAKRPDSIAVVGGADFFGRYVTNLSFLGDTFTKAIVEGKPAPICIGSKDKIHDVAFAHDFANALYIASIDDKANGKFWVCPHAIKNKTLSQIAHDIGRLAGSTNTTVTAYPGWSVRLLSPFMGFMWEMVEMLPFWTEDYSVNDSDFCKIFGAEATPYEDALKEYIQFYQEIISTTSTAATN